MLIPIMMVPVRLRPLPAATIDSTGQTLDITAGDVVIGGATVAAATLINVTDSDGNGIGLGDTTCR